MRPFSWIGLFSFLTVSTTALAQMESLGPKDSLAAAHVSAKEIRDIIAGVKKSVYDIPKSWTLSCGCAALISVLVPAS
jgi:hypothetical protein